MRLCRKGVVSQCKPHDRCAEVLKLYLRLALLTNDLWELHNLLAPLLWRKWARSGRLVLAKKQRLPIEDEVEIQPLLRVRIRLCSRPIRWLIAISTPAG